MPYDAARPGSDAPYQDMSDTLLAQQPPSMEKRKRADPKYWGVLYNHLETRRNGLRSWRWSWLLHWQVLAAFFLPRRWQWLNIVANRMWRGAPINDQIIDSTPLQAVEICAAGLWTGLMSPSRSWFRFGVTLPSEQVDEEGKAWLEDTSQRMDVVLHQSNWYGQCSQMFQDVVVFGTSPMIIYEDAEDVIRCYLPSPGEYYLGVGSRFETNTLFREYTLTILQVVEQFKLENCPAEIQSMWLAQGSSLDTEVVVCHAIEPNMQLADRGGNKFTILPPMFTYREVYWLRGNKSERPLSIKGFRKKPFVTARGSLLGNEPYGRSLCMNALGDSKQIQLESLRKAEFIEKGVRPPMGADAELKNEPASILPGQITFMNTANGKKGFWALFEPKPEWLAALVQDIDKVAARVQSALKVDLFMAITRMEGVQPRNELELTKRDLERLQQLGPFIELFEREFASPGLDRVYEIMSRRNMFKPMPDSLKGVSLKIEYQSIMRLAQESSEAVALKDFLTAMGGASAAAKAASLPDPLRIVNLDEWGREYGNATHVKRSVLYSAAQVEENDGARAKVMDEQKREAMFPVATKEAVGAAKVLSETQLNNGSALDAIAGAGAFPGQ